MGCSCGKRTRITRKQVNPNAMNVPSGRTWWFAVPPDGSSEPESMHRTITEARDAARAGAGNNWRVEGRRVDITEGDSGGV